MIAKFGSFLCTGILLSLNVDKEAECSCLSLNEASTCLSFSPECTLNQFEDNSWAVSVQFKGPAC